MSTAANETRNETLVREFFDTLSSGDLEALRPLIHSDHSWGRRARRFPEDKYK